MALSTTDLQGGTGGGLPKTIAPGNHELKINSVRLEEFRFIEGAFHLMFEMETKPIEGFEGFMKDREDESKGHYAGQIGRVKASQYAFADGEHTCLAGKEYENKSGYIAYDCWFAKAQNRKYGYAPDAGTVLEYNESKHLRKIENKPVESFGNDDELTIPMKTSSDFNLD